MIDRERDPNHLVDVAEERDLVMCETSDESFDRFAFAARALDLVRVQKTTVALCEGTSRVHVEAGKDLRAMRDERRWAMLFIPPRASRRAIAIAALSLATSPAPAYSIDVLLAS
jgi:hypothetical protein